MSSLSNTFMKKVSSTGPPPKIKSQDGTPKDQSLDVSQQQVYLFHFSSFFKIIFNTKLKMCLLGGFLGKILEELKIISKLRARSKSYRNRFCHFFHSTLSCKLNDYLTILTYEVVAEVVCIRAPPKSTTVAWSPLTLLFANSSTKKLLITFKIC